MGNRVNIKSLLDVTVSTSVRDDLQSLANAIKDDMVVVTGNKVLVPYSGVYSAVLVTDTATVSAVGDYHTISLLRNGQVAIWKHGGSAVLPTTFDVELEAYKPYYLGKTNLKTYDMISLSIEVTGAPAPILTSDNFSIILLGGA